MLLLYIFILVMIFSAVPYVKITAGKAKRGGELCRRLKAEGCRFIPLTPLWYIGSPSGKHADFVVIYGGRAIAVKVIGFATANTLFEFIDSTHYAIATVKGKSAELDKVRFAEKKKKPYDFTSKLPKEAAGLPLAKVILLNSPHPISIKLKDKNSSLDINPGDKLPEGEFYTETSFIGLFK